MRPAAIARDILATLSPAEIEIYRRRFDAVGEELYRRYESSGNRRDLERLVKLRGPKACR